MRVSKVWIGLYAVVALSGCATGLVSSWKAPDAEPFRMRGEKVAAVVMANDQAIRLAGEEALARELSARGAEGVPMYTLLAGADPDEAKARAAAERAGVVGVVVLRPVRVDKEILSTLISSDPVYGGFWGGYYGHGWGSALVGCGDSYRHHHHRRDARVLVTSEQARVVGAKQDYESCKSESPDREHGQTGRRRARAARTPYEIVCGDDRRPAAMATQ